MTSYVAVIMAAGRGTRMKSETAKVLHPLLARPLVAWVVDAAREAGTLKQVVVVGPQAEPVRLALEKRYGSPDSGSTVETVVQREARGTADALRSALPALVGESDESIAILLMGDAPLCSAARMSELARACETSVSGLALAATRAPRYMPYGRLCRDSSGVLERIVEEAETAPTEKEIRELNAGFYALKLGHLRTDLQTLEQKSREGELYLTDLAAEAYKRGGATTLFMPWEEVLGINDHYDLSCAEQIARAMINRRYMTSGVTMIAPEQVYIDAEGVEIGAGTWIGPGVHLRGKTLVGRNARIDSGCILTDVEVAEGAVLKPYSVLSQAVVGVRAKIGPFAHLRSGSTVDEAAQVGNFVETKEAHIMAGAKANHLAYLGDVQVGARANIGAGTITCNYDGFSKYHTVIEADAFIGSDSQLVAPVTVGRNAYVGSGTTVTKDVPRSSLALSRVKQINKEGWAHRFREAQLKRLGRSKASSQ